MLYGYMRVSKADGSQTVELQRDALLAAGVDPDRFTTITPPGAAMTAPASPPASKRCGPATRSWCGSSTASAATCTTWSTPSTTSPPAASG